jgi:hypothetical protein
MYEKQFGSSKTDFLKKLVKTRCVKESVREMLDRLYIIAYLIKAKFRHPVAKASC